MDYKIIEIYFRLEERCMRKGFTEELGLYLVGTEEPKGLKSFIQGTSMIKFAFLGKSFPEI